MDDPDFARQLCGYRATSNLPNTSDKHDANSIRWGNALFRQLDVLPDAVAPKDIGSALEDAVADYLESLLPEHVIDLRKRADSFAQYSHLGILDTFLKKFGNDASKITELKSIAGAVHPATLRNRLVRRLQSLEESTHLNWKILQDLEATRVDESQLKIDVAITSKSRTDDLLVALSAKWSLRTDRAQDCVSQGNRLATLRRGKMPHFATVTIEPRPSMLKLLTDTSGSIDCVYHVAYHSLIAAGKDLIELGHRIEPQYNDLQRMIRQGRLKPLDALVREVSD